MLRSKTKGYFTALLGVIAVPALTSCASRGEDWRIASTYEREIERPPIVDAPLPPAAPGGAMPADIALVFGDVRFDAGSAQLTATARARLESLVGWLVANAHGQPYELEVQGHTDRSGSAAENERLGLARAEAVRRFLRARSGLPVARMRVVGAGSRAPAGDDGIPEGRAANRRVVVIVLR